MKFSKDKRLQFGVMAFVGLVLGLSTREWLVQTNTTTNTTANWAMVAVIGGFILLYYLFMEIYTPLASRFTRAKKDEAPKPATIEEKKESVKPHDPVEESAAVQPLPAPAEKKPTVIDLKLESFDEYCSGNVWKFVVSSDIERLRTYIAHYARQGKAPIREKVATEQVDTYDLLHFGWNMWNHFKVSKQPEVAVWLKSVFTELKDIDLSTIEHNLKHKERGGNYLIKIVERID